MAMIKVSVIVPIYNVEDYLKQCLDSIIYQKLKELEIICVNDGSTDNSLEIVKEYAAKDSRIVIITGENAGYGAAMNKGLDAAKGEYIGIVEPDDYIEISMYDDLYKIAKENNLDLIKADFYRFNKESNQNVVFAYNRLSTDKGDYNRIIKPMEEKQSFRFIMNTWSGIYKRDFLEKHKIRHNETPGASFQDNGFWFQTFLLADSAMFIDNPYYMNRRDNPNSSVKSEGKVYAVNEEYKYIKELMLKNYPLLWNEVKYIFTLKKLHNYTFTLSRIAPEFKEQYLRDISKEFRESELLGEVDRQIFNDEEWKNFKKIKNYKSL